MEKTWSLVLAAGSGSRFGSDKQLALLGDRRVIDWSVETAQKASDGVTLVVSSETSSSGQFPDVDVVVEGGSTRSESVRNGLRTVPEDVGIVIIHDGARPGASADLFAAVIQAVHNGADAAIPGLAMVDTLKFVLEGTEGRTVSSTLDRENVIAVQTPQAFDRRILDLAHVDGGVTSDDAALVEAIGAKVIVVTGEPGAIKITTPPDLVIAAELMGLNS